MTFLYRLQLIILTICCMERITESLQIPLIPEKTFRTNMTIRRDRSRRASRRNGDNNNNSSSSSSSQRHSTMDSDTSALWPVVSDAGMNGDNEDGEEYDKTEEEALSKVFDSIIKIHATHSEPDYTMPWQRQHQTTSTSSGFVIRIPEMGMRVMTNAHSVEYGSIIQVQKRGDENKYEAVVESIANECDLALLRVESTEFWNGLQELQFGTLPTLQDEVEVLGYPTGGDSLSITSGVVSRIEMQEYTQADTHLLAIQIDAAINSGNSGGPVVDYEYNIVGVAFQALEKAENIGYVVPVTVVQHFLQDIAKHGKYTGFCAIGTRLALLENKTFRSYLNMRENQSGVMIRKLDPTSPSSELLKEKDVIMCVDNISVANDGKIPFRPGERVSLACYVQTKFKGDIMKFDILRDGNEMTLDVPIGISKRLVRAHWDDKPPPYLIVGGLVFTALSVPFLYAVDAWNGYISDNISYLLGLAHNQLEQPNDEVVVLAQVLAHSDNLGYDKYSDLHLVKFNDEKVRSLKHLKTLLDDSKNDKFAKFEFAPDGRTVIMERSKLDSVTDDICSEHTIPNSFVLHDWDDDDNKKKATNGEDGHQ